MEKINFKYDYDSDTATMYVLCAKPSKKTININVDEDVVLRFDISKKKAIGFTISDFDILYPKLLKLLGTKNQDLMDDYFDLSLKHFNNLIVPIVTSAEERRIFKKLITA